MVLRWLILLALVSSAVLFALYAATGQQRFKRYGLFALKWTVAAALLFFGVLIVARIV